MKSEIKNKSTKLLFPVVKLLSSLKITPNIITFSGLVLILFPAYFYIRGNFILAGIMLLLISLFDTIDGALARYENKVTEFGAFLDSVTDRIQEAIIFFSLIYVYHENFIYVLVLLFSLLFSFMISYTRARAEGLDFSLKVGPMERPERIIFLGIASFFGKSLFPYLLILYLILIIFTFLRRVYEAYLKMEKKNKGSNP